MDHAKMCDMTTLDDCIIEKVTIPQNMLCFQYISPDSAIQ